MFFPYMVRWYTIVPQGLEKFPVAFGFPTVDYTKGVTPRPPFVAQFGFCPRVPIFLNVLRCWNIGKLMINHGFFNH